MAVESKSHDKEEYKRIFKDIALCQLPETKTSLLAVVRIGSNIELYRGSSDREPICLCREADVDVDVCAVEWLHGGKGLLASYDNGDLCLFLEGLSRLVVLPKSPYMQKGDYIAQICCSPEGNSLLLRYHKGDVEWVPLRTIIETLPDSLALNYYQKSGSAMSEFTGNVLKDVDENVKTTIHTAWSNARRRLSIASEKMNIATDVQYSPDSDLFFIKLGKNTETDFSIKRIYLWRDASDKERGCPSVEKNYKFSSEIVAADWRDHDLLIRTKNSRKYRIQRESGKYRKRRESEKSINSGGSNFCKPDFLLKISVFHLATGYLATGSLTTSSLATGSLATGSLATFWSAPTGVPSSAQRTNR